MPSFDVVSEVDKHVLTNAVDQANRLIGNRFDLVLVAARRARQIAIEGKEPLVERGTDKPTVIALREIELGLVTADTLEAENIRDQEAQDQAEFTSVANISIISDVSRVVCKRRVNLEIMSLLSEMARSKSL